MSDLLTATVSIQIDSDSATVWKWLTTPELIKQYFFGTQTETDWKKGSPIFFRGEWEGKQYEDKGTIIDIDPGKFVKYNYWSSMSGTSDVAENYADITYRITPKQGSTILTIVQEGIKTEKNKQHSEQNWNMVFTGLKNILEKK